MWFFEFESHFVVFKQVALDGLKYALYDTKVDCWSFGMLMYEVIALKLPHDDIDGFALPQHVVNGNKPGNFYQNLS